MESLQEIKTLIGEAKNICIIPSQINEPESLTATLALFYTLKDLHKNVNLIIENLPEKLHFLIPSLDFISQPKNFVISVPRNIADVSSVYYEKSEENLKIHLTIEKGTIKKDDISFYFSDSKPDLVITLGIQDFQQELQGKLDSFGFLLDSPILNIDHVPDNKKFGKINIIEEKSLTEISLEIIRNLDLQGINKNIAQCMLTGLMLYYQNFQSASVTPEIFELCAHLMKQGASRQEIIQNLYQEKIPNISSTNPIVIANSSETTLN